jgi:hypothetical protein
MMGFLFSNCANYRRRFVLFRADFFARFAVLRFAVLRERDARFFDDCLFAMFLE